VRRSKLIEHEVVMLVGQRVFGIALGYEDLNDHDELRNDPLMAVLAGKLVARRSDCAPVAGKSTLNPLELSREAATQIRRPGRDRGPGAYVLLRALRRIALPHTQFAHAICGTIRLKLLKIGALVTRSVRRIKIAMASSCPFQAEFRSAHAYLRHVRGR